MMTHEVTYRVVETTDTSRPGERWFEIWSSNPATGYQWLVGVYDSQERAAELVKHWQEAET